MSKKTLRSDVLELLQRNARMSDQEIADRLGVKPAEIKALIAAMQKDGTILGFSTLVQQDGRAGKGQVMAIIEVAVMPERDCGYDRIARAICNFPEVRAVYLVSGESDFRVEVVGDSLQDVAEFVAAKLSPLSGVRSTATYFLLKKFKEAGFALTKEEKNERLKVAP